MNFVTYLRVSSKGQVSGDGFPRQRQAIQKWNDRNPEARHIDEFAEEGVSGTTDLISRPALSRMLDRIIASNGEITTVVVEKADRLARDLIVSELLLRQFTELGVSVIEAEGGNDLTADGSNPTSTLIRQILAAVAEFEKNALVMKLRAARTRKRVATGRCEGRKPFGELPGEAPTRDEILRLRAQGHTLRQIALRLNELRMPTREGGPWTHGAISKIVIRKS